MDKHTDWWAHVLTDSYHRSESMHGHNVDLSSNYRFQLLFPNADDFSSMLMDEWTDIQTGGPTDRWTITSEVNQCISTMFIWAQIDVFSVFLCLMQTFFLNANGQTDGQKDGRTDRHTDRQTDRPSFNKRLDIFVLYSIGLGPIYPWSNLSSFHFVSPQNHVWPTPIDNFKFAWKMQKSKI